MTGRRIHVIRGRIHVIADHIHPFISSMDVFM
jgi:hypothetical protein